MSKKNIEKHIWGRESSSRQGKTFISESYNYQDLENIYKQQKIVTRRKIIQILEITKKTCDKNCYIVAERQIISKL